jgi:hypothetical protein
MRKNYGFTNGVRGKYADRFKEGTVIVLLEPDIAKAFPNARSVNEALREILRERKSSPGSRSRPAKKKIAKRRTTGA